MSLKNRYVRHLFQIMVQVNHYYAMHTEFFEIQYCALQMLQQTIDKMQEKSKNIDMVFFTVQC